MKVRTGISFGGVGIGLENPKVVGIIDLISAFLGGLFWLANRLSGCGGRIWTYDLWVMRDISNVLAMSWKARSVASKGAELLKIRIGISLGGLEMG